ncbi:hypothetical protein FCM35_KLT06877 [Carex littledalei]|uniref:Uncharacterized protein n=1 Tax=Carex littledalei TaxID=544730 RepID=A0A833V876_9POAL|nr:hypothetical protein FCM35_KLT06877 [Carex littledalei]
MIDDEKVTIRPYPLLGNHLATSQHNKKVSRALTRNISSKSSIVVSASNGYLGFKIPAHATSMWARLPKACSALSNIA